MEDVILLDNIEKFDCGQEANSWPIDAWSGADHMDEELPKLTPILI